MTDQISDEAVKIIANLARLGIAADGIERATKGLVGVLGHFSQLQAIATTNVPESADMAGLKNITREDEATANVLCTAEDLLSRAPSTHDRLVKTPSPRL